MQERAEAHPQTEQRHVLIVEDEVLIRAPLAEHLREAGFDVIEASTADEAWSYLQTGMPVDLVFSDIRMPGSMDGLELANRVKRCYPTIPVVLTSANYYRDAAQIARLFISKPYRFAAVTSIIIAMMTSIEHTHHDAAALPLDRRG